MNYSERLNLAMNPKTSAEILANLANDEEERVRFYVALNSNTSSEILTKLSDDPYFTGNVRCAVAANPNTPVAVLSRLGKDKIWRIRLNVARNPNTPASALAKLANDERNYVRYQVARNPNTLAKTLAKLTKDKDWSIRCAVAMNLSTPAKILSKLAEDEKWLVRCKVARNPNTPCEVLAKLNEDADERVRTINKMTEMCGDEFILVEAEKLSLDDKFMQWNPRTDNENKAKELISEAITQGVKNFYRPKCDPSFTANGEEICFVPGKNPAVVNSYKWWEITAERYYPERNSRLGTYIEYGAFLGVLIKMLVDEGNSVEWAWNAVCNDSQELGHYRNSKDAKEGYELTGSRCICGFCDLGNTYKFLADKTSIGFWVVIAPYWKLSDDVPLSDVYHFTYNRDDYYSGVGWLVLEK